MHTDHDTPGKAGRNTLKTLALLGLSLTLGGCESLFMLGCMGRTALQIEPGQLPAAIVGQPYQVRLTVPGSHTPLSGFYLDPATRLPEGIELRQLANSDFAELSGTAHTPGVYPVLIYTASYGTQCAGQSAERSYQLQVVGP
ncbi:hypothetical protein [Pseudomonas sp. QD4]|uniref:hypothetical protein n=1 Tax=Pseudomonas sp. QD4 TaxID=3368618 RepID=UPI003BA2444A